MQRKKTLRFAKNSRRYEQNSKQNATKENNIFFPKSTAVKWTKQNCRKRKQIAKLQIGWNGTPQKRLFYKKQKL